MWCNYEYQYLLINYFESKLLTCNFLCSLRGLTTEYVQIFSEIVALMNTDFMQLYNEIFIRAFASCCLYKFYPETEQPEKQTNTNDKPIILMFCFFSKYLVFSVVVVCEVKCPLRCHSKSTRHTGNNLHFCTCWCTDQTLSALVEKLEYLLSSLLLARHSSLLL